MPNKDGTGPRGTFVNCQPKDEKRSCRCGRFLRRRGDRGRGLRESGKSWNRSED